MSYNALLNVCEKGHMAEKAVELLADMLQSGL